MQTLFTPAPEKFFNVLASALYGPRRYPTTDNVEQRNIQIFMGIHACATLCNINGVINAIVIGTSATHDGTTRAPQLERSNAHNHFAQSRKIFVLHRLVQHSSTVFYHSSLNVKKTDVGELEDTDFGLKVTPLRAYDANHATFQANLFKFTRHSLTNLDLEPTSCSLPYI
jgi:hypothetical protein